jgi:hypothetical protein
MADKPNLLALVAQRQQSTHYDSNSNKWSNHEGGTGPIDGREAKELLTYYKMQNQQVREDFHAWLSGAADNGGLTAQNQAVLRSVLRDAGFLPAAPASKLSEGQQRVNAAIVEAASDMVDPQIGVNIHAYEIPSKQYFATQFWEPAYPDAPAMDAKGATFKPRPEVKPSAAVAHMFSNPHEYGFDCSTANVVVYYKAVLNEIGPKRFDKVMMDLEIGPWRMEGDLTKLMEGSQTSGLEATQQWKTQLEPGDGAYFRNKAVSLQGLVSGRQGENTIYMGDGMYFGHPYGIKSEEWIIEDLNKHRNSGATISAEMIQVIHRLSPDLFELGTTKKRFSVGKFR